jgi:hypothetical protein
MRVAQCLLTVGGAVSKAFPQQLKRSYCSCHSANGTAFLSACGMDSYGVPSRIDRCSACR